MNIDINRLCRLAGLASNSSGRLMKESAHDSEVEEMMQEMMYEEEEDASESYGVDEADHYEGEDHNEGDYHEGAEDDNSMVEVDEAMLVQELRRAKKIMNESKRYQARRKENLLEAELKTIIESEVENVMKDLNLNSGWVYGNKKPRSSRKGYTHQGAYLKGIGFK